MVKITKTQVQILLLRQFGIDIFDTSTFQIVNLMGKTYILIDDFNGLLTYRVTETENGLFLMLPYTHPLNKK